MKAKIKITKDNLIRTAFKLFAQHGYSNVSIINICDEIGISRPTFYKYANSKEDLIIDFYELMLYKTITEQLQKEKTDSPYEDLVRLFATSIDKIQFFGSELFSVLLMTNLVYRKNNFAEVPAFSRIVEDMLTACIKHNELNKNADVHLCGSSIRLLYNGMLLDWAIEKKDCIPADQFFKSISASFTVDEEQKQVYKKYINQYSHEDFLEGIDHILDSSTDTVHS